MFIGFDLDGIFVGGPPLVPGRLIEWLYRGPQDHEPRYRFPSTKFEQMVRKLSHYYILRPKISNNIKFIQELSKNKNLSIYLISSRYKFLEDETFEIVKKYDIFDCFSKIYLNTKNEQPHLFKKRVLESLKLDIFVEDDLMLLKYLSNDFKGIIFLWYNPVRGTKLPEGIRYIKKLDELLILLK